MHRILRDVPEWDRISELPRLTCKERSTEMKDCWLVIRLLSLTVIVPDAKIIWHVPNIPYFRIAKYMGITTKCSRQQALISKISILFSCHFCECAGKILIIMDCKLVMTHLGKIHDIVSRIEHTA